MKKPASPRKSAKAVRKPKPPARVASKTAGQAAAALLAEARATRQDSVSPIKALKPKKARKEEFSFSVTQAFRKKFKQAAKEAGHKKSDFLQMLLLQWEERQKKPPSGASL